MKKPGLLPLFSWQVLQLTRRVRAGSPKMSGLLKAAAPRELRTMSRSSAPRSTLLSSWRGRGIGRLTLLLGGSETE